VSTGRDDFIFDVCREKSVQMPASRLLRELRTLVTGPLNRARLRREAERGRAPMMVPFYHRVADQHPNGWTISTREFARHVDRCLRSFAPMTLGQIQAAVARGVCDRPGVHFTFDDGYAENSEFAIPLLVEKRMPCTYFVTVSHILRQAPFPHDVDAGCPLPVNSVSDLRQYAEAGIEIGLHCRDHVDFATIRSTREIEQQIVVAKSELEQLIGLPVRHFAVPYGMPRQLHREVIAAVQRAGLAGFCSAFGGYNLPGRDAFHVRRFHGDPEMGRFQNWLNFDFRKVTKEPVIEYELAAKAIPSAGEDDDFVPHSLTGAVIAAPVDAAPSQLFNSNPSPR
jgi:peptidoglycan/xylan/chitin deacetylase (PgdA/CDA1 family)